MSLISEVVRRFLPNGTRKVAPNLWKKAPIWPPDVFAVSAMLVRLSGCYSKAMFTAGYRKKGFVFDDAYRLRVVRLGNKWATNGWPPTEVDRLWNKLVSAYGKLDVNSSAPSCEAWQRIAMELLAISDEASCEIGFSTSTDYPFPLLLRLEHYRLATVGKKMSGMKKLPVTLPYIPGSLCQLVPPSEACVLPKTMTPKVGCTLRSLSHNLALLPSNGIVASSWLLGGDTYSEDNAPLNVLIIPFPFRVNGTSFKSVPQKQHDDFQKANHHYFELQQDWLNHKGKAVSAKKFVSELLAPLLIAARKEVGEIHTVVMPEGALSEDLAAQVAKLLAKEPDLRMFVTGVLSHSSGKSENRAATYCFGRGKIETSWNQKKAHRWAIDEGQVQRYHLGHVLQPKRCTWWEMIDIDERKCVFYVVRGGASVSVMICEDLARVDPIHPVVQSVGPNLLIALLMDGPQLEKRWPARYATVLADDPGSAVLTVTSLGMVRRSSMPGTAESREIAMWKQPDGNAQELQLPKDNQALLLTLSMHSDEQTTLDGRLDGGLTRRFELSGARGIKAKVGSWVD